MTAEVGVRALSRRFGEVRALENVDLTIGAGRFAVLLGPSGCGKTTLLSILGGFLTPTEGRVLIGGVDVTGLTPARRPTTTVFQDYALFPHMTLGANVGFGPRMRGAGRRERRRRAREMLQLVGLADAIDRRPHELSGGQRQRVALARALAVEPEVLLLDEPLGALDLKLRRQMQDELKAIQQRVGTTFIHVTHDQEEAMAIADDIVVMSRGRVQDVGTPEAVYRRPKTAFSAAFLGEANLLPARLVARDAHALRVAGDFGELTLPADAAPAGADALASPPVAALLCIRPEHIDPTLDPAGALDLGPATVESSAFFGACWRCRLRPRRAADLSLTAHLRPGPAAPPRPGERLPLRLDPAGVVLLPAEER